MQPEQQRIAIAEACGVANRWVIMKCGLYYRPDAKGYTSNLSEAWIVSEDVADAHVYPHDEPVTKHRAPIPDYCGDLNAMHIAEKRLHASERQKFQDYLSVIVEREHRMATVTWLSTNATATQRAEAFLRTIGKWVE